MEYAIPDPSDGFRPAINHAIEEVQIAKLGKIICSTSCDQTRLVTNEFFQVVKLVGWAVELREALVGWELFGGRNDLISSIQHFIAGKIMQMRLNGFIPVRPEVHFQFKGEAFRYIRQHLRQRKEFLLQVNKYSQLYTGEFELINLNLLGAVGKLMPFWENSPDSVGNTVDAIRKLTYESGNCRQHKLDYVRKLLLDLLRFLCLHSSMSHLEVRRIVATNLVRYLSETLIGKLCIPENPIAWNDSHKWAYQAEMQKNLCVSGIANQKLESIINIFGNLFVLINARVMSTSEELFCHAITVLDEKIEKLKYLPLLPDEYMCTREALFKNWTQLQCQKVRIHEFMGPRSFDESFFTVTREYLLYFVHAEMHGLCRVVMESWKTEQSRMTVSVAEIRNWNPNKLQDCLIRLESLMSALFPNGLLTFMHEETNMRRLLADKIEKIKKALLIYKTLPKSSNHLSLRNFSVNARGKQLSCRVPSCVTSNDIFRLCRQLPMERRDYILIVSRAIVISYAYRNLINSSIFTETDPVVNFLRHDITDTFRYLAYRGESLMNVKNSNDRDYLEKLYNKYMLKIMKISTNSKSVSDAYITMENSIKIYQRMHSLLAILLQHWPADVCPSTRLHTLNYSNVDYKEFDQILADLQRVEFAIMTSSSTSESEQFLDTLRCIYIDLQACIVRYYKEWEELEMKFLHR